MVGTRDRLAVTSVALVLLACALLPPPPIPGTPLAEVREGMSEVEVLETLGEPESMKSIPLSRFLQLTTNQPAAYVEWTYPGVGTVRFAQVCYEATLEVVRVSPEITSQAPTAR